MINQPVICCVAGRSGGHIIPAHTYASQEYPNYRMLFFTTQEPIDTSIVKNFEPQVQHIPLNLPNLPSLKKPLSFLKFNWLFIQSFFKAFSLLRKHKPSAIISMGGYISAPVCLAGFILRIPITLFELNAVPGKATRYIAPLATKILVCFKETTHYFSSKKTTIISYPLKHIFKNNNCTQLDAQKQLSLPTDKKTLLIVGGSQGSRMLNYLIINTIATHRDFFKNITILHQVGNEAIEPLQKWYNSIEVTASVFTFSNTMEVIYTASDYIISRGGAGALFEILACNKPCLIIPLTNAAENHQVANAQSMVATHKELFSCIKQEILEKQPELIIEWIKRYCINS